MNADLSLLLLAGGFAILTATTALVLLVRSDLAPAGTAPKRGAPRGLGRWFLGAALGFGVIAFSIKIAIILTLSTFPGQTVAPLIAGLDKLAPKAGMEDRTPDPEPFAFRTLPAVAPAPADNPTTPEKVALGRRLFHDTALSLDRTVSCASCHDVMTGAGGDGRPTALGITRIAGKRNAPTVWNAAFQARLFWDGRAESLEDQAMGPPLNPDEMGMPSATAIEDRIAADPSYHQPFAAAFGAGSPITMRRIVQAIAAYERTLISADAPYDRFVRGEQSALSPAQQRGMWLFQSIGCVNCHSGPNFSGASLVGPRNPYASLMAHRSDYARRHGLGEDKGKAAPTAEDGLWRIPSLRNVALTGPYFHNGQVDDLREAVRVMATAQLNAVISDDPHLRQVPLWEPERRAYAAVRRLVLDSRDVDDLAAFLESLSGDALAVQVALHARR